MLETLPLHRQLRLGIDALGFPVATEVQEAVVKPALEGLDLQVSAETGSGKTLAYLIPMAQSLLSSGDGQSSGTLGLVLVPTRELARQVLKHCRELLKMSQLRVQAITGGADFKYQKSLLRKDPEIIVATPGRLLEHCQKASADMSGLKLLVLDEADKMLDMGFREDVLAIVEYCNADRQTLMLSATLQHRGLGAVAHKVLRSPQTITCGESRRVHANILHQMILADSSEHKEQLLLALLSDVDKSRALVFANKRATAARLSNLLQNNGTRSGCLHGEMSTEDRKRSVAAFRDGRTPVLCASDVAARGMDIPDIEMVINYDMPHSGDDYLHRTGRTARAGATGLAISLVSPPEWNLMISIQRYLKTEFEMRSLPGLKARYSGPKRQKSSGKAVGKKKRKRASSDKTHKATRRRRTGDNRPAKRDGGATPGNDGFAPLRKKGPKTR